MASEDFAFFTEKKPGAFFFLGSGRKDNDTHIHDCRYDFNEDLIEPAVSFYMMLIKDRLEILNNEENLEIISKKSKL